MVGKALNGMIIGSMQAEDLPEVLAIETAAFHTPWSEPLFYHELCRDVPLARVARIQGKVAGYLCAHIILDEGHILNLAVHSEFRRAGVASSLIQEMIERMRESGCRSVFLEVRASNEEARAIYEQFGFSLLGTRKNYYVSPVEDAVLMVLRLSH